MSDLYHIDPERHKRAAKTLHLVQQCEDKYGSIADTPADYKPFIKLQKMWADEPGNNINVAPEIQKEIAKKIDQGFRDTYICQKYHVGTENLVKIATLYHVNPKKMFYYVVQGKNSAKFYFSNIHQGMKALFNREFTDPKCRNKFLAAHGLTMKYRNTIWKDVPIGDFYLTGDSLFFKKKKSESDYDGTI